MERLERVNRQNMCYNVLKLESEMARRQRVTFKAHKKVTKPVSVSFKTKAGQKVSFKAKKTVTKPVTVSFLKKRGKR